MKNLGFLFAILGIVCCGEVYIKNKADSKISILNDTSLVSSVFRKASPSSSCIAPELALVESSSLIFYFEGYQNTSLKLSVIDQDKSEIDPKLSFSSLQLGGIVTQQTELSFSCLEGSNGWSFATLSFVFNETISNTATFLKVCSFEKIRKFDPSFLFLMVAAISIVGFGARMKYYVFPRVEEESVSELHPIHAILFIAVGSCALLFIFYFTEYATIALNFLFCFISLVAMSTVIEGSLESCFGESFRERKFHFGSGSSFGVSSVLSAAVAVGILALYFSTRHWILTDIIGVQISFYMLKLIRLPNLKIAIYLLGLAFFYDIFWVFLSKPIFGESVMAYAATKIDLPMKLEIPTLFSSFPLKKCSLIGLGDIVLPGFFVSFCHKFDVYKRTDVYYKTAFGGYISGLALCYFFLIAFKSAQPALLYLSPLTLIPVSIVAWKSNHFGEMMTGMAPRSLVGAPRFEGIRELHNDDSIEKGEFEL